MSNIYTKEQLIKIGWNRKQIRKIEKYNEYINFTGTESYVEKKNQLLQGKKS